MRRAFAFIAFVFWFAIALHAAKLALAAAKRFLPDFDAHWPKGWPKDWHEAVNAVSGSFSTPEAKRATA